MCDCPESNVLSGSFTFLNKSCSEIDIKKDQEKPACSSLKHDFNIAKGILQECSSWSGDNVFDHLCEIIKRILDERPSNVIDYFESYSCTIRQQKFYSGANILESAFIETENLKTAQAILSMLKSDEQCEENAEELNYEGIELNIMQQQFYWSLCGLGLHKNEVYLLSRSITKFLQNPFVIDCRFWGKIFGLHKNYYILEADLSNDEIEHSNQKLDLDRQSKCKTATAKEEDNIICPNLIAGDSWKNYQGNGLDDMLEYIAPNLPLPKVDGSLEIPSEKYGIGLNRKTYFVCNQLTDEWIELPIATPHQIDISRKIRKYLKGDLDAEIKSYPSFPGKEIHYLRTIIARITAGTYIAPLKFYRLASKETCEEESEDDEEEDDDLDENEKIAVKNRHYKPHDPDDLLDLDYWVHIRPNILPQGRSKFISQKEIANSKSKDCETNEQNDSEEMIADDWDNELIETGPNLLSQCSNDITNETCTPWQARLLKNVGFGGVGVLNKSNIWPGAYALTFKRFCDNIYIGWGHKFVSRNFSPVPIPPIMNEYQLHSDIIEMNDPTPQQEAEWNKVIAEEEEETSSEDEDETEDEEEE